MQHISKTKWQGPSTQAIWKKFINLSVIDSKYNHLQKCAVKAVEEEKDVSLCTRTGGGKSLTYECFPFIHLSKCVIIVAPLVTIMDEQCKKLNSLGLRATYMYLGLDHHQDALIDCVKNKVDLVPLACKDDK